MKKIDTFIGDIRSRPEFVAAAATDPQWLGHLDDIERGLDAVYRDPELIEVFDAIHSVIDRSNLPMKERLLKIGRLLAQARDAGRSVN